MRGRTTARAAENDAHGILAAPLAEHLRATVGGGEIGATFEEITGYWKRLTGRGARQHYGGIVAHARMCFFAFADRIPSRALYFGCEPGLHDYFNPLYSDPSPNLVDFEAAVDAESEKKCFVFRPQLHDEDETLIARSLKALFFEAVLNNGKRQKNGADMPLVAYVADEFHRFVTSDRIHGEQSFLDTCRSFGAFSVLACQSIASLRHALAEMSGYSASNEPAIDILLTNTGNKFFFRSTDKEVREFLDRMCPVEPGQPKVTEIRPPSTLKPGECYAALADGRFERRQLDPFRTRAPKAEAEPAVEPQEQAPRPPKRADADTRFDMIPASCAMSTDQEAGNPQQGQERARRKDS